MTVSGSWLLLVAAWFCRSWASVHISALPAAGCGETEWDLSMGPREPEKLAAHPALPLLVRGTVSNWRLLLSAELAWGMG